ncbi:hypothetical protein FANTH_5073 [Fusarium anthophilum]|uniref:Uncharacterized protein n=1 Tax=Fusarium anthophilum TaxID=48485 RepID=A0A8H4ZPQ7_9HYPO|nr:hypothetical protein FANTH_5073 [Fusarium anthophilum]
MATQDQSFGNEDFDEFNICLSELKLSLDVAPSRRSQKKKLKGAQTSITALADTKDGIINNIKKDLGNIVWSPFTQAEHSNFRVPASKCQRQLYEKLKKIQESDADCTGEDVDQVTSLLKSFIRQIDPDHPFVAETEESLAKGTMLLDRSPVGKSPTLYEDEAGDGSDNQPRRHRNMVFTNYNENDITDAAWDGLVHICLKFFLIVIVIVVSHRFILIVGVSGLIHLAFACKYIRLFTGRDFPDLEDTGFSTFVRS